MRFHKLKTSLLIFALGFSFSLFANEKKDEAPGGDAPVPRDVREYTEKSSKLTSLANRISEGEHHFAELVKEKNETKDVIRKQALLQEMVEVTNQRNKDVDTYNKLKDEVDLRYPNGGEHLNRRYETQSKRSVEELEGVAGLDELLTRTKKVVERKFAPFMQDEKGKGPAPRKGGKKNLAQHPEGAEEESPKLRLEK